MYRRGGVKMHHSRENEEAVFAFKKIHKMVFTTLEAHEHNRRIPVVRSAVFAELSTGMAVCG